MISLHNILSIARYERKTLFRSWFFRIFSGLSLIILFIVNFTLLSEAGMSRWVFSAIPSTIPYFNLLVLNVAQAVIAVFLASDFLKRDRKLDTTEVIYMRPMTNAEYVIGKTWGNIEVFIFLNILILAMALIFNLLAPGAAVNWFSYVLYLLLISIPTLIFIVGLSFLTMSLIQNQAVTFVLILGYIGVTLFLLQSKYYYLFDYMAFKIPLLHSEVIGFGDIREILLHRGIYFSIGLGSVFMTIYMLRRLPQSESMTRFSLMASILFIGLGIYLGFKYVGNFIGENRLRNEMITLNNEYFNVSCPGVVSNDLNLVHHGYSIEADADMVLRNITEEDMTEITLHLNPGLEVSRVTSENKELNFERKQHLILVDIGGTVYPDSTLRLGISYSGTIDEAACYLDISQEEREEKFGDLLMNADKRYAFVTPEYVLLTQEANWYPVPGVSFSPDHVGWDKRCFTEYSLTVETDESLVPVSQGVMTREGEGVYVFTPEQPLTQISLSIGNYEQKSFESNNITYSLWYFEDHDYFSDVLTDINDTVPNLVADLLDGVEREYDLTYAFNRISVVEVPAQFKAFDRTWKSFTEYMQPEQIFLPEKAYQISDADFRFMMKRQQRQGRNRDESLTPRDYQLRVLNNFMATFTDEDQRPNMILRVGGSMPTVSETTSPYYIFPQLYNFQNDVRSDQWPVMNRIFETYLRSQVGTDMRSSFMRNITGSSDEENANMALQDHSFVELLTDEDYKDIIPSLVSLKGQVFFAMLQSQTGDEELAAFMKDLLVEYKFKNLMFDEFESKTNERFGIELSGFVDNWFNERELPEYLISPIDAVKVKSGEQLKTMVSMKVTNQADVAGVIVVSFRLSTSGGMPGMRGGFGGDFRGGGGFGGSSNVDEQVDEILYLGANQTKEFTYLLPSEPRMATINTMTSVNIPQTLSNPFSGIEENTKITPYEGEEISDTPVNLVQPGEIIVDNEDPGFSITKLNNSNLLRRLIVKEDETTVKYAGVNQFRPPSSWTATTNTDFYGSIVRSAYYIKAGDGTQIATWTAKIDDPGFYDVYYYVYSSPFNMRGGFGGGPGMTIGGPSGGDRGGFDRLRNRGPSYYYFTISTDEGDEEQALDVGEADEGWALLGSYRFTSDSAVIQLSNKSEQSIVYADAIRLVKL